MGNISCVFSCCSKMKSQHYLETSKVPRPGNADRGQTVLKLEKLDTARSNIKKTLITDDGLISSPEDLEKQGTSAMSKKNKERILVPVSTRSVFPPEIIIEILSWLPVKFLIRLKCVCKQWCAVIQERHFIEKHMSRSTHCAYYVKSQTPTTDDETYQIIHGCDGLILRMSNSTQKYHIRNRATNQTVELPDPHKGSLGMAFAYVPSLSSYKLVSIYDDDKAANSDECCEVLTVGSDNSWRPLRIPTINDTNKKRKKILFVSACAVVHYIRITKIGSGISEEVLTLDLGTEVFTITTLPRGLYRTWRNVWALDWDGKLHIVDRTEEGLCVLVLEDYKKQKWGGRKTLIPLASLKKYEDLNGNVVPLFAQSGSICLTNDKKFIYYDIKTGCISKTITAPDGYKTYKKAYRYRDSLVTVEGMQPEKRRH